MDNVAMHWNESSPLFNLELTENGDFYLETISKNNIYFKNYSDTFETICQENFKLMFNC